MITAATGVQAQVSAPRGPDEVLFALSGGGVTETLGCRLAEEVSADKTTSEHAAGKGSQIMAVALRDAQTEAARARAIPQRHKVKTLNNAEGKLVRSAQRAFAMPVAGQGAEAFSLECHAADTPLPDAVAE
ncbi:hypothetical protein DDE20_16740 [Pararhodobacter oceanensis]|uniref:Uncharacterized protein n=2 Tax=Pararhodobacter oceanensis TaxID=2172121 RepID=A0A2T8HQ70_9RHOB|nr:hypothetical protein DDE20_16740 [Pararhodobacter oceanensis]